ncbi:MAG: hypothetical protein RLZZ127_3169 [Planctomycetota bacterium]|jgi:GMP synthase-like glutamine amidotransferase
MTDLLVLQHVPQEGPARLTARAEARGWRVRVRQLWLGDPVPTAVPAGTILAVLGGPMGVGDLADPAHPYLAAEVALLRGALAAALPMLGICLGAQLIAHAAGARVAPMRDPVGARVREVGWGTVALTAAGRAFAPDMPDPLPVLHWHGDACEPPPGAEILASTGPCPVQWFRLGRAHGLQFHGEVEPADVHAWVAADGPFITAAGGPGHAQAILAGIDRHQQAVRSAGDRMLDRILDDLAGA